MRNNFLTLFDSTLGLINSIIYTIIGVAVFGFMWGIVKILFNSENEVAKKEGRSFMLYGILTLFIMTSMWGLVNILNGTVLFSGDIKNYSEDVLSPGQQFPSIQDATDVFDNNLEQRAI